MTQEDPGAEIESVRSKESSPIEVRKRKFFESSRELHLDGLYAVDFYISQRIDSVAEKMMAIQQKVWSRNKFPPRLLIFYPKWRTRSNIRRKVVRERRCLSINSKAPTEAVALLAATNRRFVKYMDFPTIRARTPPVRSASVEQEAAAIRQPITSNPSHGRLNDPIPALPRKVPCTSLK